MTAISFSCPGCLPKILKGTKQTTIRKLRKRPIQSGDVLIFYWKQRIPASKKKVHRIGQVTCVKATTLPLIDFLFDNEVAMKDGFDSLYDMQQWFLEQSEDGFQKFQIIEWCGSCLELDANVFDKFSFWEYLTCWTCKNCSSDSIDYAREIETPLHAFEIKCASCGAVNARSVVV